MSTEQQENIEQASESSNNTDASEPTKTTTKKAKWLLLLSAIALLAGGVTVWRSVSSSQPSSEAVTNNIEQARLTVRTVPVNLEPIQAWTYGDGTVSAVTKKHLSFQATGTIDYLKQVNGRNLREGDRVKKGELLFLT